VSADVSAPRAQHAGFSPKPITALTEAIDAFVWFVIWLIANNVGGHEPLIFNPVNAWVATLILALALDLAASHAQGRGPAKSA
jgi:hypothetical protein